MTNPGRGASVAGTPGGRIAAAAFVNPFWSNLDPKIWRMPKDFFVYATDFLPLAAGAVAARNTIQIQADSHFLILEANGRVTETNDTTAVPEPIPITVRIFDSGSGREVMNQAIHWGTLFGDGELPGYLGYPKILKAQSTLEVELTNLNAATAFNVRISFLGFKLFTSEGYRLVL